MRLVDSTICSVSMLWHRIGLWLRCVSSALVLLFIDIALYDWSSRSIGHTRLFRAPRSIESLLDKIFPSLSVGSVSSIGKQHQELLDNDRLSLVRHLVDRCVSVHLCLSTQYDLRRIHPNILLRLITRHSHKHLKSFLFFLAIFTSIE